MFLPFVELSCIYGVHITKSYLGCYDDIALSGLLKRTLGSNRLTAGRKLP